MADFGKYLRPDETVGRSTGISPASLVVKAVQLAIVVVGYWLMTRALLQLTAGSPDAAVIHSFNQLALRLLSAVVGLVALLGFAQICLKALFVQYGLSGSRVLKRSFLRMRGADLHHVQDVEVVQSVIGKLLGYGDVVVRTASTEGTVVLRAVDAPHEWFGEIHEAVRQRQMAESRPAN